MCLICVVMSFSSKLCSCQTVCHCKFYLRHTESQGRLRKQMSKNSAACNSGLELRSKMALAILRYCSLMTAVTALTVDGRVIAAAWTAFDMFAYAPIHSHTWGPPMELGAYPPVPRRPTTTVLPLHPSPYPLFHTLPYPLPRPLLCPGFRYPPYAVNQYGRLPPQALYQNTFSEVPIAPTPFARQPLPFYPMPYTILCHPFPLPFPLPYAGAPPPR